jgi:hypothetical protein
VNKTPVTFSTPQLFSLGIGGTLSSTATRTDKFDPTWTIAELSKDTPKTPQGKTFDGKDLFAVCYREKDTSDPFYPDTPAKSSPLIESDLGLTDWLLGALFTNSAIPTVTGPRPLEKEELAAERQVLKENGFTKPETTLIVASGAFASSLVDLDDDPQLQLKKLKEKLKNELQELLKKYTRTQISNFLADGASPSELQGFLKSGYNIAEITELMKAKAEAASSGGGGGSGGGGTNPKPDTLTIEIKFIIVSNGNVTPTWKLVRVSANTGSTPLFGIGRTRTHDVIITIGPNTQEAKNTHLASQIGVAVGNANRTLLTTPSNTFTFPPFAL